MSDVPINRLGLLLDGPNAGLYVRVEPNSSGYSILKSDYPDMVGGERGGDEWVENDADLQGYFQEQRVDWTIPESDYEPPG